MSSGRPAPESPLNAKMLLLPSEVPMYLDRTNIVGGCCQRGEMHNSCHPCHANISDGRRIKRREPNKSPFESKQLNFDHMLCAAGTSIIGLFAAT